MRRPTLILVGTIGILSAHAQIDRLPHADTTRGNYFGGAVAIDGTRILVGAHGEGSCGAAYIYEQQESTQAWGRVARLVPGDCHDGLYFGRTVALSEDRALIASSAEYFANVTDNVAYVFERDSSGHWSETARLIPGTDQEEGPAGAAVGLSGNLAMVSTWGDPTHGQFSGAAYIYEWRADDWILAARLDGTGRRGVFGGAGALGPNTVVVGSSTYFENRPGFVYLFERDSSGNWQQRLEVTDVDDFFVSVDLAANNLLIGETRDGSRKSGIATVYVRDSTSTWQHAATLHPPSPYKGGSFGTEVAISTDRALVAGYDEQLRLRYNVHRVVYVYALDEGKWVYKSIIDVGAADFGSALDVDGRIAVIGAASGEAPGAAYVVHLH